MPDQEMDELELQRRAEEALHDRAVEAEMSRRSRRSFLMLGGGALAGLLGWAWLRTRREDAGIAWPLRRVLDTNGELSRDYFRTGRLAPEFPVSQAVPNLRVNGDIGIDEELAADEWKLIVEGAELDSEDPVEVTMAEIRKLPHAEHVTQLKCIEGWSQVAHWGGARFSDFAKLYPPPEGHGYVGLETPGEGYYVSLDMESAMHPQTLLCYELNGQPLSDEHGAPLRLVIPTKYGIKNLKRIGKIFYSENRPRDFWAERGYDWYAGM